MRRLIEPTLRPFTIFAGTILVLALIDRGGGYFFSLATAFSVMKLFATLSLVALGLGLSMLIREFDLSVAGVVGLSGCIAVLTGAAHPWLGALWGLATGIASGALQGFIMTRRCAWLCQSRSPSGDAAQAAGTSFAISAARVPVAQPDTRSRTARAPTISNAKS